MEQINSSLENETTTSNSNNISIPQLTDSRKQEIRKKLLERQRKARLQNSNRNSTSSESTSSSPSTPSSSSSSSNNNNTNSNTINNNINKSNDENEAPPNKEMIKKAVAFLSSPKVQSAPTSRKHSFLLSKGCTKKEIELAEKEIEEKGLLSGNSSRADFSSPPTPVTNYSQSQTPPPLPPRIYPQNVQIVYRSQPLTRGQKVKRGLLIILFGGALIKGISIVVKEQIMRPLRELYLQYAKYLKSRNNTLNNYILQVIEYCALFINNKNKDNIKHIKTIKEIENEKNNEKEKDIVLKEKEDDHKEEEKEENEKEEDKEKEKEKEKEIKDKKVSKPRKAIKLKIHKKKETDSGNNELSSSLSHDNKKSDTDSDSNLNSMETRTLSSAVQDYIRQTNEFEEQCKDAIDNYAYDLERNSDLFSGSLGQTMKLSSEVYQMVSREFYYNSSSSSSFQVDPYSSPDSESNNEAISLYTRVNNIKSEIRRLKGMLLNHKNFPRYKQRALANAVNSTPSTSSSS